MSVEIIGQFKLLQKLANFNLDNFPHSFLLLGDKGCGKHLIANHIAEDILKMPLFDITESISPEILDSIYIKGNPGLYLIDIDKISEKDQNSILKFVEEPLSHIFICLICSSRSIVLPTILNRCVIEEFSTYSAADLKNFIPIDNAEISDDILVHILKTPGNVKLCDVSKLKDLQDLCVKIVDKINIASYSNTLSIAKKINYKDEYNKYDFSIFMNSLLFIAYKKILNSIDNKSIEMYKIISNAYKRLQDSRLNKEIFVENLLTQLWRVSR